MDLRELVAALLAGDLLAARQYVADARRAEVQWEQVECPSSLTAEELSVAAAMVELLASRAGTPAPSWTNSVGAVRELLVLDPGLDRMPRSFEHAKREGPEPLRKRNMVALPDFLDVA
ncbi:MAG TPA: hypothetical protein VEO54_06060 [Thermoanaerobaculia bacterium]|nr:hypothetical protein [Thermoanaerobaculia bacterium]